MAVLRLTMIDTETGQAFSTYDMPSGWESEAQARKAWKDRPGLVNIPGYPLVDLTYRHLEAVQVIEFLPADQPAA